MIPYYRIISKTKNKLIKRIKRGYGTQRIHQLVANERKKMNLGRKI